MSKRCKRKYKIIEETKPKREINENTKPKQNEDGGIIINFSCPFSFYCCKINKNYTNYLKDNESFIKNIRVLFREALEYFQKTTFEKLCRDKNGHTHNISEDKIDLIEKITYKLAEIRWPEYKDYETIVGNYMTENLWQLGYKEGLRLVGSRDGNVLNLLFIDYHHLIEPDKNYNQLDYFKYSYCPMKS